MLSVFQMCSALGGQPAKLALPAEKSAPRFEVIPNIACADVLLRAFCAGCGAGGANTSPDELPYV